MNRHSPFYLMLLLLTTAVHAETLSDLAGRSLDAVSSSIAAKAAPSVPMAPSATVSVSAGAAERPRNELRAEDIQVYGILGVGDDLRAKVRFKSDALLVMSRGQRIQSWILASITPDTVIFELHRATGKKGRGDEVAAQKTVYLSGAGQQGGSGAGNANALGNMSAGSPALTVPPLAPR